MRKTKQGAIKAAERRSYLLETLSACNDTVWEQHLVPLLAEQDSSESLCSLSLCCKQLSELCRRYAKTLTFTRHNTLEQHQHLQLVPQRCQACTEVKYVAKHYRDISQCAELLPFLARLPRLTDVDLQLDSAAPACDTVAPLMSLLLELVRVHLTAVTYITFSAPAIWRGDSQIWHVLGRTSQLRAVSMGWNSRHVVNDLQLQQLALLSKLQLQKLAIKCTDSNWVLKEQRQVYSFLSALTSLTELKLPITLAAEALAAVAACTNLRCLSLESARHHDDEIEYMFTDAECAALQHLQQLTALVVPYFRGTGSSPVFLSALQSLKQLQVLAADGFKANEALPVLAQLPQLTYLRSSWGEAGGPATAGSISVPSVLAIECDGDYIPFEAFPQVNKVTQMGTWGTSTFVRMTQHCKQLQSFCRWNWSCTSSILATAPTAECVAALQGLTNLQHLTDIEFKVYDDAEIATLSVCSRLQELDMLVPKHHSCTALGLIMLGKLHNLQRLTLLLPGLRLTADEAKGLVYSLHCIPEVQVIVKSEGQKLILTTAVEQAKVDGIAVPEGFKVKQNDGDW